MQGVNHLGNARWTPWWTWPCVGAIYTGVYDLISGSVCCEDLLMPYLWISFLWLPSWPLLLHAWLMLSSGKRIHSSLLGGGCTCHGDSLSHFLDFFHNHHWNELSFYIHYLDYLITWWSYHLSLFIFIYEGLITAHCILLCFHVNVTIYLCWCLVIHSSALFYFIYYAISVGL